jgi:biopolymer transport protein ExbD
MRAKRSTKLLVEPAAVATGDIAFNLIVFFLVCASPQPDTGRKQTIPASDTVQQQQEQDRNIVVDLKRNAVLLNGDQVADGLFPARIAEKLREISDPAKRIVVVKSDKEVAYDAWIRVTTAIDDAGGIVTLQLEEEQETIVN